MRDTHRVRLWDGMGQECPWDSGPDPGVPGEAGSPGQHAPAGTEARSTENTNSLQVLKGSGKSPSGELSCRERKALRGRKDQKHQAGSGLNCTTVNKSSDPRVKL